MYTPVFAVPLGGINGCLAHEASISEQVLQGVGIERLLIQ